ncbi:nitroreductase [Virgibacillus byunsanensis]|uniref:Nitroreductase n=1 Tax=Virgibacillus byunsanensis TaxID=570945 RepID=A0ABW3LPH7_9BACI
MEILKTIKERRSIYNFKTKTIDNTIIKDIFTYGSYAPTHYMKEPWNVKLYQKEGKYVFVEAIISSYKRIGLLKNDKDPKTIKMIESMKSFLLEIPHHAVVYFEKEADPVRFEEEYAAVCAFIQNTQLAAWEYGVGMLWTITPYMHDPRFLEDIGLNSDNVKIAAVMQMGYPAKVPRDKGRKSIDDKMEFIEN